MAVNAQFSIAVHLMAALGYRFNEEAISGDLAGSVNTGASFVRRTLAKLSKAGLIVIGSIRLSGSRKVASMSCLV
jgi:DNA-binding IscR family transcriptional regulator